MLLTTRLELIGSFFFRIPTWAKVLAGELLTNSCDVAFRVSTTASDDFLPSMLSLVTWAV